MDYVKIPAPLFEDKTFKNMPWGQQKFLLLLYACFSDVERFTIDVKKPRQYMLDSDMYLTSRVRKLLELGFIVIDGYQPTERGKRRRVFKFKDWE